MVAEVALTFLLVVGAGLLLRSFITLLDVDLGFQPAQAMAWRIEMRGDVDERRALCERLLERVRAVPGVESVGLTDALPLGRNRSWSVGAKGTVYAESETPLAFPRMVSRGYLETMGIRVLAGRTFTARDTAEAERSMIVNATMARRLWPGRDPIGRVATIGDSEWRVVGVVGDVRHRSLEERAGLEMYIPTTQMDQWGTLELVVRSVLPPESLAPGVRAALRDVDPRLPRAEFQALEALVERAVSPRRFLVLLLGSFALAGLLLAALGIYGVISFSVDRRTQEIGIRMALGETAAQVQARVVRRTLKLAAVGVLTGLLGSFWASQLMSSLLYGISPTDPLTYGLMILMLTLISAAAGYLPARRASRTDPALLLRST